MTNPKSREGELIERRRTASENFHRAKPIEIHRSDRKVIRLIPEAVKHKTSGWRMKATLAQIDPRSPDVSGPIIHFDEDDVEVLAEALRRVAPVMTQDAEGRYVAVRLDDDAHIDADSLRALILAVAAKPSLIEQASVETLSQLEQLLSHLGRLTTLRNAVAELERELDGNETGEAFFQRWCKTNSWAFGFSYLDADRIRMISREDEVDLLLPRLFGGYRDLVELKTPGVKVLDLVRDFYHLAKPAAQALGQAIHYMSVLQRHAHGFDGLTCRPPRQSVQAERHCSHRAF